MHVSRRSLAAFGLGLVAGMSGAVAAPLKPKPPPGRDPGGIAVAMIGDGLDYMHSGIGERLARDGEGELIGWDFVDGDRRPYARPDNPGNHFALIVRAESWPVRLIPIRVAPGPPTGLVPALRFMAQTPARVAGILPPQLSSLIPQDRLAEVAANLPRVLLVVGARHLSEPAVMRPNVLAVTMAPAVLPGAAPLPPQGARADVAMTLEVPLPAMIHGAMGAGAHGEDTAVARMLALAARIGTAKPALDGAGLKTEVLSHARPLPDATARSATYGWIPDDGRIHSLQVFLRISPR